MPLPPTPVPELGPFLKQHAAALNSYASRRTAEIEAAAAASDGGGAVSLVGPRLGLRRSSSSRAATATTDEAGSGGINIPEPGEGLLRAEREIPAMFFSEGFDLSSQEAWTSLLGIAAKAVIASASSKASKASEEAWEAPSSPSPKSVLASAADPDLRELAADRAARLACLADGALVDEVAARAPIFGAAAATLGGLRGDVASVAALAREDQKYLNAAAARAAASSEHARLLSLRRKNLRAALAALEPLETARDAREALSAALSLGDFNGALLALEALRGASAAFGVVDRGDINSASVPLAVAALAEDIGAAEAGVKRLLKGATVRALHLSSSSGCSPSSSQPPPPDSAALKAIISGAVRGRCLKEVMEAVAAAGAAEAKAAVANAAAASVGGGGGSGSSADSSSSSPPIEDRLSSLSDASAFELALVAASRRHFAALRHALSCREALREVDVEGGGGEGGAAAAVVAAGADSLVRSVAGSGASRWASLLSSRPSVVSAKLPEILRLLEAAAALERETAEAVKALASSSSSMCSSSSSSSSFASSIRSPSEAASALTKAFIDSFHSRARSWLVAELDADDWLPSAVPEGVRSAVARLEEVAAGGSVSSPSLLSQASSSLSSPSSANVLIVRGVRHPTAAAGLALAAALCEYATAAAALPSSAASLSSAPSAAASSSTSSSSHAAALALRAAELAKVFNGRACQLVLGAGALAASGGKVKALTARRLAVASRTLGLAAAVVEVARDAFFAIGGGVRGGGSSDTSSPRKRRGDSSAAGAVALACAELDSAVADLAAHRAELHSKLSSLVSERCAAGLGEIAADPGVWLASGSSSSSSAAAGASDGGGGGASAAAAPAPPPSSSPSPSSFARDMSKHLSSLESALTPLLSSEETASILGRAAAALSTSCAEALSSAAHKGGVEGRAQAAADGRLLLESLRALKLPSDVAEAALAPLEAVFAPPKRRKQQQQREVVAAEEEEAKAKAEAEGEAASAAAAAAAAEAEGVHFVRDEANDDSGITAAVAEEEAATEEAGAETAAAETTANNEPDVEVEVEVVEGTPAAEEGPEEAARPLSPPPTATLPPAAPPSPIEENNEPHK